MEAIIFVAVCFTAIVILLLLAAWVVGKVTPDRDLKPMPNKPEAVNSNRDKLGVHSHKSLSKSMSINSNRSYDNSREDDIMDTIEDVVTAAVILDAVMDDDQYEQPNRVIDSTPSYDSYDSNDSYDSGSSYDSSGGDYD